MASQQSEASLSAAALSVISICFNNLNDLKATCISVDEQTEHPAEHLIIDGSTNAEIKTWLEQTAQPAYRRLIHERDKGISDAFNKGIANAQYSITHLLNSGDRYAVPTAIETVMNFFRKDKWLMWMHSKYIQHRGDIDVVSGNPFDPSLLWKGMRTVAHPTMFIKKEVYDRCGNYNEELKIAMDYDMLIRMRNESFIFYPEPLIYFEPGGASDVNFKKGLIEVRRSFESRLGKSWKLYFWQLRQRTLNIFMKTTLGKAWFKNKNSKAIANS